MRLAVIGAFPLDVLQEKVIASFSNVPSLPRETTPESLTNTTDQEDKTDNAVATSNGIQPTTPTVFSWDDVQSSPMADIGMPLTRQCLYDRVFYVAPVRDRHLISVTWQIPAQTRSWRTKPCDYIAHLLGHEAQGSLLASLKSKSWATGCCAGVGSEGYEVCALVSKLTRFFQSTHIVSL